MCVFRASARLMQGGDNACDDVAARLLNAWQAIGAGMRTKVDHEEVVHVNVAGDDGSSEITDLQASRALPNQY